MNKEEYIKSIYDIAYLSSCAINKLIPDKNRVESMNIANLYIASHRHMMSAIVAMALESAGINNRDFSQDKGKSIRKNIAFDVERKEIQHKFEECGIWYMHLKGIVLKDFYPSIGMRQMSDNDILIDATRANDVKTIMESLGYTTGKSFGFGAHDVYTKKPIFDFEMHRSLFVNEHNVVFSDYYKDIKKRLIKNDEGNYGYHFSDEDFYIFMIAHEFKHYSSSGTGIRSLFDTYVYLKQKSDSLNWTYISEELDKLKLSDFEKSNRLLSIDLFETGILTNDEKEIINHFYSSGAYGSITQSINNQITKKGKIGYLISCAFPSYRTMKISFPFIKYCPIMLPFCWIIRFFKSLVLYPKKVLAIIKALFQ